MGTSPSSYIQVPRPGILTFHGHYKIILSATNWQQIKIIEWKLLQNKKQMCQFQLGTSPPGNPQGLAQKTCPGGRDLTFESCPGAGNSTRAGILWKMKLKLQKTALIEFLDVKKKTSRIFDLFRGLHCKCFSMEFFLVNGSIFGSAVTHTLQKIWGVAPGLLIWSFHWVMVIHAYFLHKRL